MARVASSVRTQKIRRSSAAALTCSLTAVTSVAAITYQAPSRSSASKPRSRQATSPEPTSPSMAGVTAGRDDQDVGAHGEQGGHPALRDVPAADHDHPAAVQHQSRG